ncbi:hypothetical protein AB7W84_19420 [Providencia rettgeri]
MNYDNINTDLILLSIAAFAIVFFVGGLITDEFFSKKASNIYIIITYITMLIGSGFLVSWLASIFILMYIPILVKYIKQEENE